MGGTLSRHWKKIAAALSIALVAALLTQINLAELASALASANLILLSAALVASTAGLAMRTLRWKTLLDEKSKIPFQTLFPIQSAGLALSNFSPGKMADPVKVFFLKPFGVRYSFSLITVVWERIFDLFLLFSASLLVASIVSTTAAYGAFALMAAMAVAAMVMHKRLAHAIAFFSRFKLFSFLKKAEAYKFKKRTLAKALALTFVIWGIDFFATWIAFKAAGVALDYLFLAGAMGLAIVIGVFTFLPGGIGSTEISLLFLLSMSGYPQAQLLAGIVLARAATLGFSSLAGASMLPFIKTGKQKQRS